MNASELANGKWDWILERSGVSAKFLTGKHTACPICGGTDRFRFSTGKWRDKGRWWCSHCSDKGGDGFDLLRLLNRWSFKVCAEYVVTLICGTEPVAQMRCPLTSSVRKATRTDDQKVAYAQKTWNESVPISCHDPVGTYLKTRTGLVDFPETIRYHPKTRYHHPDNSTSIHPAMIARVQAADGSTVAIHRTYLTSEGMKAPLPSPKRITGILPKSSAVRLFEPGPCMGIAEGIETAISASLLFGLPVWAALSANGLSAWEPPINTQKVIIFADNDEAGRSAARTLLLKLNGLGQAAKVRTPDRPGEDWNDVTTAEFDDAFLSTWATN